MCRYIPKFWGGAEFQFGTLRRLYRLLPHCRSIFTTVRRHNTVRKSEEEEERAEKIANKVRKYKTQRTQIRLFSQFTVPRMQQKKTLWISAYSFHHHTVDQTQQFRLTGHTGPRCAWRLSSRRAASRSQLRLDVLDSLFFPPPKKHQRHVFSILGPS